MAAPHRLALVQNHRLAASGSGNARTHVGAVVGKLRPMTPGEKTGELIWAAAGGVFAYTLFTGTTPAPGVGHAVRVRRGEPTRGRRRRHCRRGSLSRENGRRRRRHEPLDDERRALRRVDLDADLVALFEDGLTVGPRHGAARA